MPAHNALLWTCLGVAVAAMAGCEHYRPLPLTSEAVEGALAPPSMEAVRVRAKAIRHPILKSVEFDERNGLSADEAAILAVLANPTLRAIRDQRGVAAAQVLQAGILPNPVLTAEGESPIRAPGEVNGYTLDVGWDISALIARGAKVKAAKAQAASVELDIAWQEWQVAQAAKTAVFRRVALEAQLAEARQAQQGLQESLTTMKAAAEQGLKTTVDLAAAEAAAQEAYATVLDLEQDLHKQRLTLARLLGLGPDADVRIQNDVVLPSRLAVPPAEELTAALADRRLDLLALKRGYESQEAAVRAAILAQFPKMEVGLHHTRDSGNFFTLGPFATADLPIFDRNQGNIAGERATRQRLFDEFAGRLYEARSEIAMLLAEADSVTRKIAAAEAAVPVMERLVKTYEAALEGRQVDILSYYGARNDLAKKRIESLKLKQELVEIEIGLEIASGRYLTETAQLPGAPAAPPQTQPLERNP